MVAVGTRIAPRPPAQIPACAANAPGSSLGSNVGRHAVKPRALQRTAANRIDVATRLSVRTTAACRLFPSGEALPSTISAGSCLPLFDRFLGTTTSAGACRRCKPSARGRAGLTPSNIAKIFTSRQPDIDGGHYATPDTVQAADRRGARSFQKWIPKNDKTNITTTINPIR